MFATVDLAEAVRILANESGSDEGDLAEIAAWLGGEVPVLGWAAGLARTIGWRPLRRRIAEWALPEAKLPWQGEVEGAVAALSPDDARLLAVLAACDAPFAWDVLEDVMPAVTIESIVTLEAAKLLRRSTRAGVVTFLVPYGVRAIVRAGAEAARWLDAWTRRAEALRGSSYGVGSRATLAELAAAIPLATHALFTADRAEKGLDLWLAAADALFFGDAIAFDAPAFERAVEVADAGANVEAQARARIVAGRARLERGDPVAATTMLQEAARRAAPRDDLRAEAERGAGWAALALTQFDAARALFESAREHAPRDPRTQADATAGLGIRALMMGDATAARGLFEEAIAIHVVMRDAPRELAVRGMLELLPAAAASDVASALAADVDKFRATGQRWREALTLARLALAARARGDAETERARLLEARAAAAIANIPASNVVRTIVEAGDAPKAIVVGAEGRSLVLPAGDAHDLTRHGPVRRILWALATARTERPGTAMSTLEVIEAGWPGEKMQHEAATLRVYTTIRRLRSFGLGDVLVTRDDGYLLDPDIPLTRT